MLFDLVGRPPLASAACRATRWYAVHVDVDEVLQLRVKMSTIHPRIAEGVLSMWLS